MICLQASSTLGTRWSSSAFNNWTQTSQGQITTTHIIHPYHKTQPDLRAKYVLKPQRPTTIQCRSSLVHLILYHAHSLGTWRQSNYILAFLVYISMMHLPINRAYLSCQNVPKLLYLVVRSIFSTLIAASFHTLSIQPITCVFLFFFCAMDSDSGFELQNTVDIASNLYSLILSSWYLCSSRLLLYCHNYASR